LYKLIIVDDEEMIRQGVVNGILWRDLGFEVIGQAENGMEALDLIEQTVPDVVVTDIRMPEMDGVELMQYLAEKIPSIKVVVLSGYDDFEYLKSSIRNNVFDYLLKPTNVDEFVRMFKKLKTVIDHERQKRRDYEALKKSLQENLPYLEQIFLNQLITGFYHDINEIKEKKNFYKLETLEGKLAVVVLEVDNIQNISKQVSEEQKQMVELFIIQQANNMLNKNQGKFFRGHDNRIMGICSLKTGMKSLLITLKEIQQKVFAEQKLNMSVGVSNAFENLLELNRYSNQAKRAIRQKLCLGSRSIILFSDLENVSETEIPVINFNEETIVDFIFAGEERQLSAYINSTLDCLRNKMFKSFEAIDSSILKLLFGLDNYFQLYGISVKKILQENGLGFQKIYQIDTLEQKIAWLDSILKDISQAISAGRNDKVTKLIGEVKRYLEKNYANNSTCLESVADLFKKSPPYMSKLFKNEVGENFSDYLTKLRMEKAKELLKNVTIKVYEVSSMVGYADTSHFSRKFKSYTGLSPVQYKNENGRI